MSIIYDKITSIWTTICSWEQMGAKNGKFRGFFKNGFGKRVRGFARSVL